ncbi:MAG: hypothetical protein GEV12_14215 [Micromonosporaceae bacterium]|nr:hypothetical protein [Micromonosporaceae bacterium]
MVSLTRSPCHSVPTPRPPVPPVKAQRKDLSCEHLACGAPGAGGGRPVAAVRPAPPRPRVRPARPVPAAG